MTDAGFFRGTSAEQDNRFSDKEKKLMKQMRFGENVTKKVDMSKIKIDVLRPWISKRIEELLGMEDDVIEEFVVNQLEADQSPDGRRIQINLTGFLNGKNARIFTAELWDMLLSAQEQSTGIPASLIESKKAEIKKRNEEQEKEKKLNETLKKTVSRFAESIKAELDSPSNSSNLASNIKREKTTPDRNSTREVDFSKRKEDGGRRQYRSRRTSSPSPTRRSRSRDRDRGGRGDRDRDRRGERDFRRDRDRSRERERDRRREPLPTRTPPGKIRRSPPQSLLQRSSLSYRDRDRSRERERDRDQRSNTNRRYSDHFERDRERDRPIRNSQDDRLPAPGRRQRDMEESRGGREREDRDRDQAQNGKSNNRQPLSPSPRREIRSGGGRRYSDEPEIRERRDSDKIEEDAIEENSEQEVSNDSGQDEPQAKRAKKEKKSKKDKKKHKKHKKTKKSKKSKSGSGGGSSDEDEEMNEDNNDESKSDDSPDDRGPPSYLKGTLYNHQASEDLERKLRERALESLKKATSSH